MNSIRLKEKIEQQNNLEYIIDNNRLNNYLKNKNMILSKNSISNIGSNNLNKSNNNSKKLINYHYSFFISDFSNKYRRNLNSLNFNSQQINNTNSDNQKINNTLNNLIRNKENIKNMIKKNSINNLNKNKNQGFTKYYSKNTISSLYNLHDPYFFYKQTNSTNRKKKNSSLSNTTSKDKNFSSNPKYVEVNLKDTKNRNLIKKIHRQKLTLDDINNINPNNNKFKINANKKKKLTNLKINSRNNNCRSHNYSSNNFQYINNNNNNKSTIVNIKHINNKIMNYIQMNNNKTINDNITNTAFIKNKKNNISSQKKKSFEKYNTVTHSPTNNINKKVFFNFLNISKMIYENNKMKEKNDNLSMQ